MDLSFTLLEITTRVLESVMTAALPVLVLIGIRYLNQRFRLSISEQQARQVSDLAVRAVTATSQKFQKERQLAADAGDVEAVNRRKRGEAMHALMRDAQTIGVKLAEDVAADLVESAVNRLKRGLDPVGPGQPAR